MKWLIFLIAFIPSLVFAEVTPRPGPKDPRIRVVNYDEMDIVKIYGFPGVETHIKLEDGEIIQMSSIAEVSAWTKNVVGSSLYLQPKTANHPDTNLHLKTSKHRHYSIILKIADHDRTDPKAAESSDIFYGVFYKYPSVEQEKKQEQAKEEEQEVVKEVIKNRFEEVKERVFNDNYFWRGDWEITPDEAVDDGSFVALRFRYNKDFPEIYEIDKDGKEFELEKTVEDNKIIIKKLVKHMMLRRGQQVAEIKTFDKAIGVENTSGTIDSSVVREVVQHE